MRIRLILLALTGLGAVVIACLPSCAMSDGPEEALDCQSASLCEEVNTRYSRKIDTIVETMNSCERREDCTSAVPTLGCPNQATWLTTCAQGIRADSVADFQADVDALGDQFCSECDLECHHDDEFSCTAPIAKCEEGRCVIEFMEDV